MISSRIRRFQFSLETATARSAISNVHPRLDHDIQERGIDEYVPIWNILDLTPEGRGTFYAALDYGTKVQAART